MSTHQGSTAGARRSPLGWVAAPFWNREEGRVRGGWRGFFPMFLALVILVASSMLGPLVAPLFEPLMPGNGGPFLPEWFSSIALRVLFALAVLLVWALFLDRRRVVDYGYRISRGWWADLLGGLAIGAFVGVSGFVALLALGWASVTHVSSPSASLFVVFSIFIVGAAGVAFWEETLFRGLAFKNLAEALNRRGIGARGAVLLAWLLSSVGFTMYHLIFGFGWGYFFSYMVGSLALGLVYVLTGQLAFPIGFHMAFDLFVGGVFVADPEVPDPAFELPKLIGFSVSDSAPELFVGPWGILQNATIVVAMLLMLAWVRWRRGELKIQTRIAEWTPRKNRKDR